MSKEIYVCTANLFYLFFYLLFQWKQGDAVPESWRDFYRFNPCVPVDYPSINSAFSMVRTHRMEQTHSIRVLLRPGKYYLREAITIQAPSTVHVEIETMELPASIKTTVEPSMEVEISSRRRSSTSLRNILSCRSVEVEEPEIEDVPLEFPEAPPNSMLANPTAPRRATLILRTRRLNEPLVRVRQGCCTIRNVELRHICNGIGKFSLVDKQSMKCSCASAHTVYLLHVDIWNGNAAVQIQPPVGPDDQPLILLPAPTCVLDGVEISSSSGRGIVNIDGGQVTIRKCYVHDCAATGIYVGGPGSRAAIEETDVVRNGNGNSLHRRGIARGHSGIYLEQGRADIKNCNVSKNSLTGISAVSPDNAFLNLSMSDLVANGTYQLEMPAVGTLAHRESVTQNNNLATVGRARSRSGLVIED
jgi:hypothetical protein